MSSQESRKDPRSKILNLTVRYKSATVAEFVEDYSYDISRGGLFIKTTNPFPTGTLLKFEVRIGEEKTVIDGVGRVTWRRERTQGPGKPAGMGIKFIRIADECVQLIQNAVDQHAGGEGQFEEGAREQGVFLSEPPANLRSLTDSNEEETKVAPVPRMFPAAAKATPGTELDDPADQSMLFQSTELLKAAMSKVAPANSERGEEHSGVEDRVTLPTGASQVPPAPTESVEKINVHPTQVTSSHEASMLHEEEEQAPDSSEEVTKQFVPGEHHPVLAAQTSTRSKPAARRKNPKKKKKKFNYTSLPAPKHSKPPTSVAAAEQGPLTSPPKARAEAQPLPLPSQSKPTSRAWLVGLGVVVVGSGLFIALTRGGDKTHDEATRASTGAAEPSHVTPTQTANEPSLAPSENVSPDRQLAASASATTNVVTTTPAASEGEAAANATSVGQPEEAATTEEKEAAQPAKRANRPRVRRRAKPSPAAEVVEPNQATEEVTTPAQPAAPPATGTPPPTREITPQVSEMAAPSPQPREAPVSTTEPRPTPAPAPSPAPAPVPPAPPAPVPPPPAPPAPIPPAPAPPSPPPPPTPAQ